MAGDWIKMRTDLYRNPKVCVMADLLMSADGELARYVDQHKQRAMTVTRNVMRNVTVGALVSIWGVMRTQGKPIGEDLFCSHATISVLDDISELPGFGAAMAHIGWVVESYDGLTFPRFFSDHNVDPEEAAKKKNAERQARFRDRQKPTDPPESNVTDNVTVTHREEKRREEKYTQPNGCVAPQSVAATPASPKPKRSASGTRLPQDWFLPDTWGQWGLQKYPHFSVEIIRDEATKFANHWRSKTGKDATKLDWLATWQNWLMSDICQKAHPPESGGGETNYQRSMRERVEQAAGSLAHIVAAKAPGAKQTKTPNPWDVAIENNARTTAIGMD